MKSGASALIHSTAGEPEKSATSEWRISPRIESSAIRNQRDTFARAAPLVRLFYTAHFWHLAALSGAAVDWPRAYYIDPLWPIAWISVTGPQAATYTCLGLLAVGATLASLFPQSLPARAMCLTGLLLCAAFDNSFGKIDHGYHMWIAVGAVFLFLPSDGRSVRSRYRYLLTFGTAQAVVLASYSLAGAWKLLFAAIQLMDGQVSAFSAEGFSYLVAARLLQTSTESLLGPWIIEHYEIGRAMLLSGIFVELLALAVIFRPALHAPCGLALILMHVACVLTITIDFSTHIVLIGFLLVCSPFRTSLRPRRGRFRGRYFRCS